MTTRPRPASPLLLAALVLAALLLAPVDAGAGGFSTTNVQLLQGYGFDDGDLFDLDDGLLTTLTLNHFSTWELGDNFLFADLTRSRSGGQDDTGVYLEWHPRLFLSSLLGQKQPLLGVVRSWGLAGEVNQAGGYYAYLAGLGVDFAVPAGWVLGLNVYYRYDKFALHQWQVSPFWTVPFSLGPVPFLFTGFVDVNGTEVAGEGGWEVWAQPQLLADVLAPFGGKAGRLHAGVEWYLHTVSAGGLDATSSVPQVMVQWTIF